MTKFPTKPNDRSLGRKNCYALNALLNSNLRIYIFYTLARKHRLRMRAFCPTISKTDVFSKQFNLLKTNPLSPALIYRFSSTKCYQSIFVRYKTFKPQCFIWFPLARNNFFLTMAWLSLFNHICAVKTLCSFAAATFCVAHLLPASGGVSQPFIWNRLNE